jgi:hypothetical protein
MKPVKMIDGLNLSGDVYINKDTTDVSEYELSVNMGAIMLKAPYITLQTQYGTTNPIIIEGYPVKIINRDEDDTEHI